MYVYSILAYGFNFSDSENPDIGIPLSPKIMKYLEEGEFQSHYSGCSNPYYIGVEIMPIDPVCDRNLNIIDIAKKYSDNIDKNKIKYDKEIQTQIDNIISSIVNDARNYINVFEYTEEDVLQAVDYFNKLKTMEPLHLTLIATS